MRLIIEQDNQTVAVIEGWHGPIPRVGDYIYVPPVSGQRSTNVMQVKVVTWMMLHRPAEGSDVKHFVGSLGPYVEITV